MERVSVVFIPFDGDAIGDLVPATLRVAVVLEGLHLSDVIVAATPLATDDSFVEM